MYITLVGWFEYIMSNVRELVTQKPVNISDIVNSSIVKLIKINVFS